MKGRLAFLIFASLPALGSAVVIDFDDAPAPELFANANPLRDEYSSQGLTFSGPAPLDGGAIVDEGGQFGVDAHSGDNFLGFNFNSLMMNGGVPNYPERVTFDFSPSVVSIWVAGGSGEDDPVFFLKAYDSGDNLVDFDTTTAKDWMQMTVGGENISYVEFYLLESGETDKAWVADDLSFLRPVPEPATMVALGIGAVGLAARKRRSRRQVG
jgi:hypothetical protein